MSWYKRIIWKDGTFRPQYWLFGWASFKDRNGAVLEFLSVSEAMDLLDKHDPYHYLKTFLASTFLSTCLGFALLFLTVYLW